MRKPSKKILWVFALILALPGVAMAMAKRPEAALKQGAAVENLKICELKVDGMTCGGCERAVEAALSEDKGFAKAEVSHAKGSAVVRYDPAKTSPEKLAEIVTQKAGYKASVKKAMP